MKKLLSALVLSLAFAVAQAQPTHVVISQVFGAGGNSGSPFTHDFVELFNPTDKPVSIEGWTLQYAAPADDGRKWDMSAPLKGSIEPGKYYLVQLNGGTVGKPLPTPDLVTAIANGLGAVDGKLTLVNSATLLTEMCPTNISIVDFVGYGKANCFESKAAPAAANTKGLLRKNNGCMDTDDNAADFSAVAPSPRNSALPASSCNGAVVKVVSTSLTAYCITPSNVATGSIAFEATGNFSNATFNVLLSDAIGSFTNATIIGSSTINGINLRGSIAVQIPEALTSSNAYRMRIDVVSPSITGQPGAAVEIINGAVNVTALTSSPNAEQATINWTNPAGCFDEIMIVAKDGATIDGVPAGDGSAYIADLNFGSSGTIFNGGKVVYKGTQSGISITGLQIGKEYTIKAFTRNGTYWSNGAEIKVKTRLLPMPGEIVINQVSPQYDSASHEYIELVNTTGKTFDLSELSISYHAKSGNKAVAGNTLSGTLKPHSYWLLSPKEMVIVGRTTLPRDGHCTDGFAATAGQIALLRKTDSTVIDGFGYGSIDVLTYTESQPAAAPLSKGGYRRKKESSDTNNNSIDFERVANADIDLRNSNSRLALKDATLSSGNYSRVYVTGNSAISGDVTVSEKVVLQNGLLQLSNYNISIAKTEGGSADSYLQTNGSGTVTIQQIGETEVVVPIGNKTYNPVAVANGGGVSWQAHVADGIQHLPVPFNDKSAVLRTWLVKPLSNPLGGATIQLHYQNNEAQVSTLFTNADVQVWNYTTQWLMAGQPQKQMESNSFSTVVLKDWNKEGTLVIVNAAAEMASLTVLPIKFMNVKATELPHAVQIDFTNSAETDVAHYIIERSTNGIEFVPLATINPIHNNGSAASYQWIDKTRASGSNFYRVKGVEVDGKVVYSIVLKITVDKSVKALNVFPNPIQGRQLTLEVGLPKGSYMLRITAINGQQVMEKKIEHAGGNISKVLELPAGLRPGQYLLQFVNGQIVRQQLFVVL